MQDYQWSTTTGRIHQKLEDDAVLLILLYDQYGNFIKLNMQISAFKLVLMGAQFSWYLFKLIESQFKMVSLYPCWIFIMFPNTNSGQHDDIITWELRGL